LDKPRQSGAFVSFRQPGYPDLGIRGFPRLRHLWSSGPPTIYGGQASHDYSWFGFIELLYLFVY
jgi:hypothetical protein